jgi:hypothetical protein
LVTTKIFGSRKNEEGDVADGAQGIVAGKHAGRIVQIGNDDEAGARREMALDFSGVETEAVLEAALEVVNLETEKASGGVEQFVAGCLDEHLVTGLGGGGEGEIIGQRGAAVDVHHAFGSDVVFRGKAFDERLITVGGGAVDFKLIDGDWEFGKRVAHDPAGRQVEARLRVQLGEFHVGRKCRCTTHLAVAFPF